MVFFEQLKFDASKLKSPSSSSIAQQEHLQQHSATLSQSRSGDVPVDTDPTKNTELFFKGMVLTPTKDRQYIKNFLEFRLKRRLLDDSYKMNPAKTDANKMFLNCDTANYLNGYQVYVICWRQLTPEETLEHRNYPRQPPKNLIAVRFAIKLYNSKLQYNEQLQITDSTTVFMIRPPEKPLTGFKNILSYNGLINSVNLALWSEDGEIMIVWKLTSHKFSEIIYPL